jgi:hypothetical protein
MLRRRPSGPVEDHTFPPTIEARLVTPGPNPRLHGFSVEEDLSLHYRYPELVLLALTGTPPEEAHGRAFDVVLQFLAPLAIAEAPTHAAMLARICGAPSSSILSVACIALAERARHVVSEHMALIDWFERSTTPELPVDYCSRNEDDRASVERLKRALAAVGVEVPRLELSPSRWTATFMTLYFAGLHRPDQWEAVLVMASLAPVCAEAQAHSPGVLTVYPMDLPDFLYEESS